MFQALQTENQSQFQKHRESGARQGGADADFIIGIPVRPDKTGKFLPNRMDLDGHPVVVNHRRAEREAVSGVVFEPVVPEADGSRGRRTIG